MLPQDWNEIYADVAMSQRNDDESLDSMSELLAAVRGTSFESVFTESQCQ